MILLLKLLLAHILGDFFFQPTKWVKHKDKHKLKSVWLYLHIAIHVILMFIILWDLSMTLLIISIGVIHLFIDGLKLIFQNKKNKRYLFFIDQLLHLFSIIAVVYVFKQAEFSMNFELTNAYFLGLICALLLINPTAIAMRAIFSKWNIGKLTKGNESLKDAGKYIGILERLLVFVFIITEHWEAVGFLITAKSVFRFGDLTASKERKLTEYILIGTLISFGIAIFVGLLFKFLLQYV